MRKRIIFYSLFASACVWVYFWIQDREQIHNHQAPAAYVAFPNGMRGSKENLVEEAWGLMSSGQHDACMKFVDNEFAKLEPAARKQEAELRAFPELSDNYLWHELDAAGNLLRVKQESLLKKGRMEETMRVWETMFRDFPHFQSWRVYPNHWRPALEARGMWQTETLLRAIHKRDLEHYEFTADTIFDWTGQQFALSEVARTLLEQGDFDSMEYAVEFLTTTPRWQTPSKSKVLFRLCQVDVLDTRGGDRVWKARRTAIEKWMAAKPQSKVAPVMLAEFWKSYAWKARGSGWSQDVDEADLGLFVERMKQAHAALDRAPRDLPMWYSLWIAIARAEGRVVRDENAPHHTAWDIYHEGLHKFPWFAALQSELLTCLLERWQGEPGDWQRFALACGTDQGPAAYLELMTTAAYWEGSQEAVANHFTNWELLKKAFEQRIADEPGNVAIPQQYAAYARIRNDRAAAKRAFALCGDKLHPDFFHDEKEFDAGRQWANQ